MKIVYNKKIVDVNFEELVEICKKKHSRFGEQCMETLNGFEHFLGYDKEDFVQLAVQNLYEEIFLKDDFPLNVEFFGFYNTVLKNMYVDLQRTARRKKRDTRVISINCQAKPSNKEVLEDTTFEGVLYNKEDGIEETLFENETNLVTFLNKSLSAVDRTLLRLELESKLYKLNKKDALLNSSILYTIQVLKENVGECGKIKNKNELCSFCGISRVALYKRKKKLEENLERLYSIILSGNMEAYV